MKKRLMVVMAMLLPMLGMRGQTIKPLSIGDTVPDILLTNIINYPVSKIQLSELHKGKYLVLDFWSTMCGACIKGFPYIYQLQKKYGNQVSFLLVNSKSKWDERTKIESFFAKRAEAYTLASAIEDTVLTQLFPHHAVPHCILIDRQRVFVSILKPEEINDENFQALVYNNLIRFRKERELPYDPSKLLFIEGNGGSPRTYLFRSILTGYQDGLPSTSAISFEEGKTVSRIHCANTRVLHLFRMAYPAFAPYPMSRTIFKVRDPSAFSYDSSSSTWCEKHLFNYELSFPPRPKDVALKMMQEDLRRYFPLTLRAETRKTQCLVLRRSGNKIYKCPMGAVSESNISEKDGITKYLNKQQLISLMIELNNSLAIPVLDETDYKESVCLKLPANLTDISALSSALAKQGFSLKKEERQLSFLIIEDITLKADQDTSIYSTY